MKERKREREREREIEREREREIVDFIANEVRYDISMLSVLEIFVCLDSFGFGHSRSLDINKQIHMSSYFH